MRDDIVERTLNVISERLENIRQMFEEDQKCSDTDRNESVSPIDDTPVVDDGNLVTIDQLNILEMITVNIDNFRNDGSEYISGYCCNARGIDINRETLLNLKKNQSDITKETFAMMIPVFLGGALVDDVDITFPRNEFAFTIKSRVGTFDMADCSIYLTVPGFPRYFLTKKYLRVGRKFSVLHALKNI